MAFIFRDDYSKLHLEERTQNDTSKGHELIGECSTYIHVSWKWRREMETVRESI